MFAVKLDSLIGPVYSLSNVKGNQVAKETKKKVETCVGCGNQFERIRMHLAHSKSCKLAYDLDEMKNLAKKKDAERKRSARANTSMSGMSSERILNVWNVW